MKKLFLVSALLALPLVACDSGATAPDNSNNPVVTDPQPINPTPNLPEFENISTNPIAVLTVKEYADLTATVSHCRRNDSSTGEVRCFYKIKSSRDDRYFTLTACNAKLIDNNGNIYPPVRVRRSIDDKPVAASTEWALTGNIDYYFYADFNYTKSTNTIRFMDVHLGNRCLNDTIRLENITIQSR